MIHNQLASTAFFNSAKKLLPFLIFFSIQFTSSFAQVQTQKAVSVKVSDYLKGYYESLPVDYSSNSTKKYPLLIFLHGVGERGNGTTQLPLVLKNAIPKIISKGQFPSKFRVGGKDFSFIVISPQYSSSSDFVTTIWKLIEHCKKKYRVDEKRIYLTGLSMGGLLAWNFTGASKTNADAFAAMVTVCGGGVPNATRVANIASAKLPVWVTNNSGDPYNPASRAKQTVDALNAYKPAPPKAVLTIFQKGGHDAWTQSYDPNFRQNGMNVYEWMLSYTSDRGSQASPSPVPPVAKAGSNQTITLPANSVTLSASGSTAPSGTIKSYSWKKISGPSTGGLIASLTAISTKITGLVQGVYQYELTVTDSNGNTSKATVTITVNAAVIPAPTAKAGSNQTITLPATSVTVDASGSTAAAGAKIKSYAWTKKSGPAAGKITAATAAKTTITGLTIAGTYVFQVVVKDDKGKSSTASVTITVKAAAVIPAPTAKAGSNQTITLPASSVTVDAGGSAAASGAKINSYTWTKKSGPAAGKITTASAAKTTITGLTTAGTYVFQVVVKDDKGKSSTASVTITVKPSATTSLKANAGADQTITFPASSVTLDGSKSTAAEGNSIRSYLWEKTSGPNYAFDIINATSAKTSIEKLVPGTYVFRLKITDNKGAQSTDNVIIKINYRSGSLKANAGPDRVVDLSKESTIVLDGSASTVPGGNSDDIEVGWSRLSGPKAYGALLYPSVALNTSTNKTLVAGVYEYRLTIKDAKGNVSSDVVKITVKSGEPEVVLKANAGADQIITSPASSVTLDGSKSTAAEGNSIRSYLWEKTSGPNYAFDIINATSAKTSIEKLVPGTYVFRLKITDNKGAQSTDNVTIKINYRSGSLKANAGPDRVVDLSKESTIILDGSASTVPGGNSDDIGVGWSRLSGPKAYGALLYPSVALNTSTNQSLVAGVYQFRLTLRDGKGNVSTDVVKVTVKAGTAVSGRSAADTEEEVSDNSNALLTSPEFLNLKINPNPVRSDMNVWVEGRATGKVSMLVYNLQGRVLLQQEFTKDAPITITKTINVSHLPAGSYLVQVIVDGKHRKSTQIIKQ